MTDITHLRVPANIRLNGVADGVTCRVRRVVEAERLLRASGVTAPILTAS
ncbi:MAG: hypothetical protein ACU0CO_02530 [Shimia sp.]